LKELLLKISTYPRPLRLAIARKILRMLPLPYENRILLGLMDRPHYGYCIFQAAKLAKLLDYPRVSIIEFGCGGGNGLLNAEMHIVEVMKIFMIDIELYGFDLGSGLPCPHDYRDMPHYFRGGAFEMDRQLIERRLKRAKLVIGDVKEKCPTFFQEYDPAPIGGILWDLDFYSSTRDAMRIFDAESSRFLPRVFMYFDDIIGDDLWLCNDFTGEMLAIKEFNEKHQYKKISPNYSTKFRYSLQLQYENHVWTNQLPWTSKMYIYHNFEHCKYNEFVARKELIGLQEAIKLE